MAKTTKLELTVWFWFMGHDMVHCKECSSDASTLKMVNQIGTDRNINVFLVNAPELSKPLQTVVPPEFKPAQQSAYVYTLDSDDDILPDVDELLTQRNEAACGNDLGEDHGKGKCHVEPAVKAPF